MTTILLALTLAPGLAHADAATAPRTEAEAAVQPLVSPLEQRLTVRNDGGRYDVWLISSMDFDKASETLRKAIGRADIGKGLRLQRWTWLEVDRSYMADLTGPARATPWPLRLTRHASGSLLELKDMGLMADAPPWAPAYRPLPILLPHGSVR